MKKQTKKQTKKLNAKSVLKDIVDLMNQKTPDSIYLWDILTALRGPDDTVYSRAQKHNTTARLRSVIGLNNSINCFLCDVNSNPVPEADRLLITDRMGFHRHFQAHHRKAVDAVKQILGYSLDTESKIG